MKRSLKWIIAATIAAIAANPASAATLYFASYDYGSGFLDRNPPGNDPLFTDAVLISEASSSPFFDSFDFSSVTGTIQTLRLTLQFSVAGGAGVCSPEAANGLPSSCTAESWFVRTEGFNFGSQIDDDFRKLTFPTSQTFIYTAPVGPSSNTAFARAISSKLFKFGFTEMSAGNHSFALKSARFIVTGEPAAVAVPVPAALPMMAAGLGALGLIARRRQKAS